MMSINEINDLQSENKHLNDLLNQALKEQEELRNKLQEVKMIADENKDTAQYGGICRSILQKIAECEVNE